MTDIFARFEENL